MGILSDVIDETKLAEAFGQQLHGALDHLKAILEELKDDTDIEIKIRFIHRPKAPE